MATIRSEINILNKILSATTGTTADSNAIVALDTSKYDGTVTYYFEVVTDTSSSITNSVTLRRNGTSTDDATCSIPLLTTGYTLIRSAAFTPPAAALTEYIVHIAAGVGATTNVKCARIVIVQTGTITKTQLQFDIGNDESTSTATLSSSNYASPKMFTWTDANWNCTRSWFYEAVMATASTKITITSRLYVTSGSNQVSTTSTTPSRQRIAITATKPDAIDGVISTSSYATSNSKSAVSFYGAKIIVDCTNLVAFEAHYLLDNTKSTSTGAQTNLTKWDTTEWSGVTNTYKYSHDALGATASSKLIISGGADVSGATVTGASQQISAAFTAVATNTLDTNITVVGTEVDASRIIAISSINALATGFLAFFVGRKNSK